MFGQQQFNTRNGPRNNVRRSPTGQKSINAVADQHIESLQKMQRQMASLRRHSSPRSDPRAESRGNSSPRVHREPAGASSSRRHAEQHPMQTQRSSPRTNWNGSSPQAPHVSQLNLSHLTEPQNSVLLVLMIEIRNGVYDRVLIRQNDDLHQVAHRFRQKHGLPVSIVQPLIDYIESNMERKLGEQKRDLGASTGSRSARQRATPQASETESYPASARSMRSTRFVTDTMETREEDEIDNVEPDNLELRMSDAVNRHESRRSTPRRGTPNRSGSTPRQHHASSRTTPISSRHTSNTDLDHMSADDVEVVEEVLTASAHLYDGQESNNSLTTRHKLPDLSPFHHTTLPQNGNVDADISVSESYETKAWAAKQRLLLQEYHTFMDQSKRDMERSISNIEKHDLRLKHQDQKIQSQDSVIEELRREILTLQQQYTELQKSTVNCVELISNLRKKTQSQQVIIEGLETDVLDLQKQNLNLLLTRSHVTGGILPSPVKPVPGVNLFSSSPKSKERSSFALRNMTPEVQKYLMSESDELLRPKSPSNVRSRDVSPPRDDAPRLSEELRHKVSRQRAQLASDFGSLSSSASPEKSITRREHVAHHSTESSDVMLELVKIAQPESVKEEMTLVDVPVTERRTEKSQPAVVHAETTKPATKPEQSETPAPMTLTKSDVEMKKKDVHAFVEMIAQRMHMIDEPVSTTTTETSPVKSITSLPEKREVSITRLEEITVLRESLTPPVTVEVSQISPQPAPLIENSEVEFMSRKEESSPAKAESPVARQESTLSASPREETPAQKFEVVEESPQKSEVVETIKSEDRHTSPEPVARQDTPATETVEYKQEKSPPRPVVTLVQSTHSFLPESTPSTPTVIPEQKASPLKPKEIVTPPESVQQPEQEPEKTQEPVRTSPPKESVPTPESQLESPSSFRDYDVHTQPTQISDSQDADWAALDLPVYRSPIDIPEEENLPLKQALLLALKQREIKRQERLAKENEYEMRLQAERRALNEKLNAQAAFKRLVELEKNNADSLSRTESSDHEKGQRPS